MAKAPSPNIPWRNFQYPINALSGKRMGPSPERDAKQDRRQAATKIAQGKAGRTAPAPTQYTHPAPTAPFLTAPQQTSLTKYDTNYSYGQSAFARKISDAVGTTNMGLATNQLTHDKSANMVNQNLAARGIFQSSIRLTDLNDLDTTLTMRNNILNTNLQRLTMDTQSRMTHATTDYNVTHNLYNTMAVQNAQGIPPVVPQAIPPAPRQPAAPKPPQQNAVTPSAGAGGGSSTGNPGAGVGASLERSNDMIGAGKGLGNF